MSNNNKHWLTPNHHHHHHQHPNNPMSSLIAITSIKALIGCSCCCLLDTLEEFFYKFVRIFFRNILKLCQLTYAKEELTYNSNCPFIVVLHMTAVKRTTTTAKTTRLIFIIIILLSSCPYSILIVVEN